MFRSFFSLGLLTLLHLVVSFVKQLIISKNIGVSAELDRYLYTLTLINLLHFYSSPISDAATPQFHHGLTNSNVTSRYFSRLTNTILVLAVFFVITGSLFVNYSDEARRFFWILSPLVLLNTTTHVYSSLLNSMKLFVMQSLVKTFSGILTTLALWLTIDPHGVDAIAYSFLASVVIILAFQIFELSRNGIKYIPSAGLTMDSKFYKVSVGLGVTYFYTSAVTLFERETYLNLSSGMLSAFGYASSVFLIPAQFIWGSVSSVVWTRIMDLNRDMGLTFTIKKINEYNRYAIPFLLYLSASTAIFSEEIATLLFLRGKTTQQDIQQIAKILSMLIWAIPALFYQAISGKVITTLLRSRDLVITTALTTTFVLISVSYARFFDTAEALFFASTIGGGAGALYVFWRLETLSEIKSKFNVNRDQAIIILVLVTTLLVQKKFSINFATDDKIFLLFKLAAAFLSPLVVIASIYHKTIWDKLKRRSANE